MRRLLLAANFLAAVAAKQCDVSDFLSGAANPFNALDECASTGQTHMMIAAVTAEKFDMLESVGSTKREELCECVETVQVQACSSALTAGLVVRGLGALEAWCVGMDACPQLFGASAPGRGAKALANLLPCASQAYDAHLLCECLKRETSTLSADEAAASREAPPPTAGKKSREDEVLVVSPGYGSRWALGSTLQVLWATQGDARRVETVRVALYRVSRLHAPTAAAADGAADADADDSVALEPKLVTRLAAQAPNTGAFDWAIPPSLDAPGVYWVKV